MQLQLNYFNFSGLPGRTRKILQTPFFQERRSKMPGHDSTPLNALAARGEVHLFQFSGTKPLL